MNYIKMKLLNYGEDPKETCGYYLGKWGTKPVIIIQVLINSYMNVQLQIEHIVELIKEKEFPRKKFSSIHWIEYWPKEDFPKNTEMAEVTFDRLTLKKAGLPKWKCLDPTDTDYLIHKVVEPIEIF